MITTIWANCESIEKDFSIILLLVLRNVNKETLTQAAPADRQLKFACAFVLLIIQVFLICVRFHARTRNNGMTDRRF